MQTEKLIVKKGYTITVDSWENDGDNNQTKSKTVDTLEEATALYNLMQLCVCKNNQPKGVIRLGNSYNNFSQEQIQLIENFLLENPILGKFTPLEDEDDNNDHIYDIFMNITYKLLGNSNSGFVCRVMEHCEVTYSDKDVYANITKINIV